MCCEARVCKQPCKASETEVSVSPLPQSWQHPWMEGIATGGRAVACDLQDLQTNSS